MNGTPLLSFRGVSKSFAGVRVLRAVSFDVGGGRMVGLVGENGAGKSTLMNILGGNLRADEGHLRLEGREFSPANPAAAARQGIAFVHQELNLFANLTIAENLFLTGFPWRKISASTGKNQPPSGLANRRSGWRLPLIDRRQLHDQTARLLREVGLELAPETLVEHLSAGERQLVEIAKALSLEAKLIILDEPTTSLSTQETEKLFSLLQKLRARGLTLIYISHTLADVLRLCDDLVILRDGEVVGQGTRAEFDENRMISLMVGRSLNQLYPQRKPREPDAGLAPAVLEVQGITQPGMVKNITFTVRRSEVLGLSGLMGAGRSEMARILFGLDPCARGTMRVAGRLVQHHSIRRRIQQGLAFLTENRREEGLCLEASIADNIALVSLRRQSRPPLGLLNREALADAIGRIRAAVQLTPTARDTAPVKNLSGGNQQKVVLAKWLLAKPSVLILDEPTRGIDVGAKFEIYQLIHELADQGTGVLVISSELEELIGICDRILVLRRGEIVDELARPAFDRERILKGALGA